MYAAVARLNPATGESPAGEGGWYPEEKLSVEQALLGFTRNAAYGWFKEGRMGAIEKGKWADFVVVDRKLGEDGGKELKDVIVKETWVGGRRVFRLDDRSDQESWIERVCGTVSYLVNLAMGWTKGASREDL
jgi:predicted amidohydrolase YtcJ